MTRSGTRRGSAARGPCVNTCVVNRCPSDTRSTSIAMASTALTRCSIRSSDRLIRRSAAQVPLTGANPKNQQRHIRRDHRKTAGHQQLDEVVRAHEEPPRRAVESGGAGVARDRAASDHTYGPAGDWLQWTSSACRRSLLRMNTHSTISCISRRAASSLALVVAASGLGAQRPTLCHAPCATSLPSTPPSSRSPTSRVIDGTGAPPREDQTVIIRDGHDRRRSARPRRPNLPAGAQVIDLTGKSVIPGLVMLHEHLFYPTGPGVYGNDYVSFTRLYLAGGVTSMRTAGERRRLRRPARGRGNQGRRDGRARGSTPPRRTCRARRLLADVRAQGFERRAALRELLGRCRRDVVQGVHEHHAPGVGRGDRRRAQARAQGHRPSLLRHLSRSGGPRHRRSRARLLRRDRFRRRTSSRICVRDRTSE